MHLKAGKVELTNARCGEGMANDANSWRFLGAHLTVCDALFRGKQARDTQKSAHFTGRGRTGA
jgi:hypothetical protein